MAEKTYQDNGEYEADPATYQDIQQAWNSKYNEIVAHEEAADLAEIAAEEGLPVPATQQQLTPATQQAQQDKQVAQTAIASAAKQIAQDEAQEAPARASVEELLEKARQEAAGLSEKRSLSAAEAELANARQELARLQAQIAQDPLGLLKGAGHDPLDLANRTYLSELGDQAPEDFKKKLEQSDLRQEFEAFKKAQEEREEAQRVEMQQRESQAVISQLDNELVQTVQNVPEQYEVVRRIAGNDPQYAYQALVEATTEYWKATGGKRFPTAQQALQIAEAGLARIERAVIGNKNTIAKTPAPESTQQPREQRLTKTLSDTETSERTSRREVEHDPTDFNYWAGKAVKAVLKKRVSK